MPDYIDIPVDNDPDAIATDSYDYMQAQVPGWVPNEGNLETILIDDQARIAAATRDRFSRVPRSIFRQMGSLVSLPAVEATKAQVNTTWTVKDNAGYTIEAGWQIGIRDTDGTLYIFEVLADVVIPVGQVATPAGGVTCIAVEPGIASSDLGAAAAAVELVTPVSFVTAVTQQAATAGGADAESDDDYLTRLANRLSLLGNALVLPRDYAAAAMTIAGVERALGIDGYNPGDDTFDNPRMVTIALMAADGGAVSGAVKTAVDDYVQANREYNFEVFEMDPNPSTIDVTYHVKALSGYDTVQVKADVDAAIAAYLSPLQWGKLLPGTLYGVAPEWTDEDTVRYLELVTVVRETVGVAYVISLTFAITGNPEGVADVVMPGPASVPVSGAIVGTVDA